MTQYDVARRYFSTRSKKIEPPPPDFFINFNATYMKTTENRRTKRQYPCIALVISTRECNQFTLCEDGEEIDTGGNRHFCGVFNKIRLRAVDKYRLAAPYGVKTRFSDDFPLCFRGKILLPAAFSLSGVTIRQCVNKLLCQSHFDFRDPQYCPNDTKSVFFGWITFFEKNTCKKNNFGRRFVFSMHKYTDVRSQFGFSTS